MQKRLPLSYNYLEKAGVEVDTYKHGFWSDSINLLFETKAGPVTIKLIWSKVFGSLSYSLTFPKPSKELEEVYDSFFPQEKTMFGRSSPSFRQSIIDFHRGQEKSSNPIKIVLQPDSVLIQGGVPTKGRGDQGLLDGLKLISKTFRTGPLHNDVLFHLFA